MARFWFSACVFLLACTTKPAGNLNVDFPKAQLPDTVYSYSTRTLKLDSIPEVVFSMTELRELHITGEDCDYRCVDRNGNDSACCWDIDYISPRIKNCINLEVIDMPVNVVSVLPKELAELKKLKVLNLCDNVVSNAEVLSQLTSLEEAYFYGCHLKKLPSDIGNLVHLKHLALAGNPISEVELARIRKALPTCDVSF